MQHNLSSSVEESSEDRTNSTVKTVILVEDHVFRKEMNRFIKSTNGINLSKLIHILHNDILYDKPENIMDYILLLMELLIFIIINIMIRY
jgi:hypothetical protein